ncbi:MAG TPA: MASE1 domain-containing protein [Pyrinomonadaceae bacterium]|nr:MASE1 domain-containing protein [Pyrinomonadaceae bacterium]
MDATAKRSSLIHSPNKTAAPTSTQAKRLESYLGQVLIVLAVAAVYFLAARLGLAFAFIHSNVSPVWPPTGIAIAAVLLFGKRVWPGIFLGALLANAVAPVSLPAAAGIALGNTLEAVLAALLLRFLAFHISFDRARDVFKFVIAASLCTTVSATMGTLTLCLSDAARWDQFGLLWLTWWLGDLTGALTAAPLLLTWSARSESRETGARYVETALLILLLSVSALVAFGGSWPAPLHYYPLTRLIIPFLLWAAFRLGPRGVTLAIALLSTVAVWGTVNGAGPFIGATPNDSLITLQLFIATNAVTFLFLAAVVEERRLAEEARRVDERRLATNLAISRILAESPALNDAMQRILKSIGETLGWKIGAMWTLDHQANALRCLTIWSAPGANANRFESLTIERTFAPGIGLPGRIWRDRSPCWIPDVALDDNFPRAPVALAEGLHSGFAFPILAGEKFLGAMEFFSEEIRQPDNALLAMFGSVGNQIGQFMERRRAEEKLIEFFENATEAINWVGEDGTILRANQAELQMLGYSAEEYIGRNITEFHVDQKTIADILERLSAGETLQMRPAQMRRKDGSIVDVLINSSAYFENGRFIHTSCFTRDVTEQLRADKALRQLASIVETTDDVIIGKDLNGIVTSWNAASQKLYGYTAGEMIGTPVSNLIPPDRPDEEPEILSRLRRGESVDHYETVRMSKDGKLIQVSLTVSPIRDASGQVIGCSKIARDITDRKRAEAEREALLRREHEARAEAEEANRVKDEFLATLSHELRTPLNAILGWSTLLRNDKLGSDDAKRAVEIIERNARVQSQLIEGVLDVSRIVSGKLQLTVRPLYLSSVIEAAIDSMRPAADARNMSLQVPGVEHEPLVSGDANRLQQVVWNLLSNAVKFSPPGGEITVQLQPAGDEVEIVVRDTGQGISAEFLPHVFDRFRQADSSTTRKHGGLGLGLAIVRHLVELHGGSVTADSEGEGRGATFRVSLPSIREDSTLRRPLLMATGPASIDATLALAGLKVLIVEDHPDARHLLTEMLLTCNAEVKAAMSAAEALKLVGEWQPEVVVSDISMPDVDGYEFIRELRALDRNGGIPAIAVTAYAHAEDRERALAAGFQSHLSKPVELSELVLSIAEVTGRPNLDQNDLVTLNRK